MEYSDLESQEVPALFQDIPSEEILVYHLVFLFTAIILIGLDYVMVKICQ